MESKKLRLVATLLCGFLGTFGIHRFYVGKIGTGIAQLLLTISFIGIIISSIWALIDFILLLSGSFKDKEGNNITQWT